MQGRSQDPTLRPSAETPVHAFLYRSSSQTNAVLHTHSVTATVLSRVVGDRICFSGFEMQKALGGCSSHEEDVVLPVFDNSQNMEALVVEVGRRLQGSALAPGILLRGHGLYAWGASLREARRHLEGMEFLCRCAWEERRGA